ncbi:LPS-assembly protein LptD [Sagittula sp. SSi028]|uniref:LPS-assembly protein LptD n=1 Tax=Sagittula sp. SSi028 TaxID=3400636 RepID=UPI003AF811D3
MRASPRKPFPLAAFALAAILGAAPIGDLRAQDSQAASSTDAALLIADNVTVEGQERLVATGNVEALQGNYKLSASRIVYDRAGNLLTIDGPIRILDPDEGILILADAAELDEGFRNGLMKGARMVIDQHLQLAAVEANRVDGRYTQLSRTAVTSCQVCGPDETPLWQIRATRVIHDQEERQLYFHNPQFRVLNVPVFWMPRMRMPDPTLDRARGFLFPSITSSSLWGTGVRLPYFIPIGDSQDVTLTPHLTTESRTLELTYRRAFRNGNITVTGAVSGNDFREEGLRSYAYASGNFSLPRDFTLSFGLWSVSDDAYLNDYDYSSAERLASNLSIQRVRDDRRLSFSLISYETLRSYESNATQPGLTAGVYTDRRFFFDRVPGEFRLSGELVGLERESTLDVDSDDDDNEVDGRDTVRFNIEGSWQNRWTLPGGLRAGASTYLFFDHYVTEEDAAVPHQITEVTPAAAVELRYPFQRIGANGGRTLFEPVMQASWTGGERGENANEESTRVEFDEANLLSISRFTAADRRERGVSVAAGVRWVHQAPAGWSSALTLGQLWQADTDEDFTRSSGLDSSFSDVLIAARFANPLGITISARGLMDEDARFSKAEARAGWSNSRMDLGASYLLLVEDEDEYRDDTIAEWTFDGQYQILPEWKASTEVSYDLADRRLDEVALGLQYRNECIQVELDATREFASSTNLEPSTDFELTVELIGFGIDGSAQEYRRTCR